MMRRIFGLPERQDPGFEKANTPRALKVGAGDILTWKRYVMQVSAALSLDEYRDVCLLDDGKDQFLVVFDSARGNLWEANETGVAREWPIRAESIWDGDPIRVRGRDDKILIQWGEQHFVADLTTPGFFAEWVNSFGRPNDTSPSMEITTYIDPKES